MDINTLTIGDARQAIERGREIEAALGGAHEPKSTATPAGPRIEGLHIVILDRGFVYVGDVAISGDWLLISNAKNVRRWGTTQGLGELAAKGPQLETKLDIGGHVKAPMRSIIGLIRCEDAVWRR